MTDLHKHTASEIKELIIRKETNAVEVVKDLYKRIKSVDSKGAYINIGGPVVYHVRYYFPGSCGKGQPEHAVAGCDD